MNSLRLLLSAFMGEEVRVFQVLTYGTDSLLYTFSDTSRNSCHSVWEFVAEVVADFVPKNLNYLNDILVYFNN